MKGSDLRLEWLETDDSAMREPIVVETPEGLGMKMPPNDFTVDDVVELVGEDTPVEVIGIMLLSRVRLLTDCENRCCIPIY
jgi:F-box/leucine-rich repeat protein 10/11